MPLISKSPRILFSVYCKLHIITRKQFVGWLRRGQRRGKIPSIVRRRHSPLSVGLNALVNRTQCSRSMILGFPANNLEAIDYLSTLSITILTHWYVIGNSPFYLYWCPYRICEGSVSTHSFRNCTSSRTMDCEQGVGHVFNQLTETINLQNKRDAIISALSC